MEEMKYFYEVFEHLPRCGPGDDDATRQAFLKCVDLPPNPNILDIGCGTGMQTIELARISKGKIIALDNYQPFLNILKKQAEAAGQKDQILTKNQSMKEMDFDKNTFDLIWSEGALYIMGFQEGLKTCCRLLKKGGYSAVTEAVYLTSDVPEPVKDFWDREYPSISDINSNIAIIENEGFHLVSHFTLPETAWLEKFYYPMETVLIDLKEKYKDNKKALIIFDAFNEEIEFYKKYSNCFGYEFFIMQKK